MSVDVYWRIAMEGDPAGLRHRPLTRGGFAPRRPGRCRPAQLAPRPDLSDVATPLDYMAEVAKASEIGGFTGGLLPSFPSTDDPWAAAASLAAETSSYRFMVAFQPGFLHPVQAARMSASLQLATGGRLVYNIISGGGGPAQLWWGDKVAHDDRYARTSEFLDALKSVWTGSGDSFDGRFYSASGAALPSFLAGQPFPEVYFSGSSPAAIAAAGRHADYYLSWLEPAGQLAEKFELVRAHSAAGAGPRFAVRVDVLARETEEQAWEEIRLGWPTRRRRSAEPAGDSVGAARGRSLAGDEDDYRALEVEPNVWGGFDQLRPGPAFGLVGDYGQVAARLDELISLGAGAFILAGVPHLEEAYRVGRHVLPLVKGLSS